MLTQAGAMTYGYDQNGLLRTVNLGGVVSNLNYSQFGELQSESNSISGNVVFGMTVSRDKLARIITKSESEGSSMVGYTYSYDQAGRLTEVKRNGSTYSIYSYDDNGNRVSKTIQGVVTNLSYDSQDRLVQSGNKNYGYSLNGDLESITDNVSSEIKSFEYDEFGNLKKAVMPGKTIEYIIDGMHRRVGRKLNGTLMQGFVYQSQYQIAAELNANSTVKSRFIYGSKANVPDYMTKDGRTYRIISDQVGSVRMVVDSLTGETIQSIVYDEFGQVLSDSNPGFQPFAFAGCLYDQDVKFCRFGARDYDAETGRWTSKDPIRFGGGATNLYGYTFNDPINFIDPSGLIGCKYSVTTGHLTCTSNDGKQAVDFGTNSAFSGSGLAKDNPGFESARDAGPVPSGHYRLDATSNPDKINLNPAPLTRLKNWFYGRSEFQLHPGSSSIGCITLPRSSSNMSKWGILKDMMNKDGSNNFIEVSE